MLSSEQGVYIAESVAAKNMKQAKDDDVRWDLLSFFCIFFVVNFL